MSVPEIFKRRAWSGRVVHYFTTLHLGVEDTLCGRKLVPHDGDAWYTIGYPVCGKCSKRYAALLAEAKKPAVESQEEEHEQATAGDLSGGEDAA